MHDAAFAGFRQTLDAEMKRLINELEKHKRNRQNPSQ